MPTMSLVRKESPVIGPVDQTTRQMHEEFACAAEVLLKARLAFEAGDHEAVFEALDEWRDAAEAIDCILTEHHRDQMDQPYERHLARTTGI